MKEQYDVIIIGGGISGMTNAGLLSKFGFTCCIIEKEPVIGGYLQGFKRQGFTFDTSIHWLNQCDEEGIVTKIFKIMRFDYPKALSMPNIHRYKNNESDYLLTNNPEKLKESLIKDFPYEEKGIRKFFKAAKRIGESSKKFKNLIRTTESMNFFEKIIHNLKVFKAVVPMIPYVFYNGDKGIEKGLNTFFKDKKLHRLFSSEKDLLSCLFPIAWAYNNDYQAPVTGGGQMYIDWLKHVINHFNNDIILNSEAAKIIYENDTIKGVEFLKQGKTHRVFSKYIISAIDIETLYKKLIKNITTEFLKKHENAVLYDSGVTIFIAINCKASEIGIHDERISLTRYDIKREDHYSGNPLKSAVSIISPSERDKSLAPENKGTLNIYIPADISYNDYWQTERDDDNNYIRGDKYKKHKQKFAEILIERVEKELNIDIKSHILFYEVSTPITYLRYTGNKNGSIMGARPGKKNMQLGIAHYKTPVNNLFVSGHWAELGGGIPIAVQSAINSSLLVVKEENKKLYKLLKNYIDGKINFDTLNKSNFLSDYIP